MTPTSSHPAQHARYMRKLGVMVDLAVALRELGTDPRGIKVGACVFPVDCSSVLGIGYNGVPHGVHHGSVLRDAAAPGSGTSGAAHAEANALMKAGDAVMRPDKPCLLVTTLAPCPYCAAMIANCLGIVGVIYCDANADIASGLPVLWAAGLQVAKAEDVLGGYRPSSVQWWMDLRPSRMKMPGQASDSPSGAPRSGAEVD